MRALMVDNYDSFTYNLVGYMRRLGWVVETVRNDAWRESDWELLVLSPGPGRPSEAGLLMRYIEKYHAVKPIFGVCLGLQALNEFFGGTLKYVRPVHGKARKIWHDGAGAFRGLPNPMRVGRYHSLAVDRLGEGLEAVACAQDGTVMGLRHRHWPIEAVQFHPESVLTPEGLRLMENLAVYSGK